LKTLNTSPRKLIATRSLSGARFCRAVSICQIPGLLISANYQWSPAIDDGSLGGEEYVVPENSNYRSCERSSSSADMR
jgi:hypothetical protein